MSADWPKTLLDKAVYPHPVSELRLIETHISWVILTGPFAYKIKKPVNLGFLDFSTLALRRHYCVRELELNRRFAEDLYLDVVPITGSKKQPRLCSDGSDNEPIIDYAVKMRQFDNRHLANNLARHGMLSDELVKRMAKMLAGLHNALPPIGSDSVFGTAADIRAAAMENFSQICAYSLPLDIRQTLTAVQQWTTAAYQQCLPLLEQRRREGYVKDCHGDCHLGNIVIINDKVTLFDCIEFNDSIRIRDTIAEAAFLSMDLCAHGLPEQSQLFLNTYLEYRGDYSALPLLNLFRCYYAMVRAKVDILRQPVAARVDISVDTNDEFYRYVALSERFTKKGVPALVLMHGLSGSGKSFLAERIATKINAVRIRSDVERKRLFHLAPEQSGSIEPNLYSKEASQKTFERLLALSQSVVASGFICIVDATFLTRSTRKPFIQWAERSALPFVILHCNAPEATVLQRLQQRARTRDDPSDADFAVYQKQKSVIEPFSLTETSHLLTIDTEQVEIERDDGIELVVSQLRRHIGLQD